MFVPSHAPPHIVPAPLHGVREPCGVPLTATHVPSRPFTSHAWHCAVHAALQQKPSAQSPIAHIVERVHAAPVARLGTHALAAQ
jgi:hypothetical protein